MMLLLIAASKTSHLPPIRLSFILPPWLETLVALDHLAYRANRLSPNTRRLLYSPSPICTPTKSHLDQLATKADIVTLDSIVRDQDKTAGKPNEKD